MQGVHRPGKLRNVLEFQNISEVNDLYINEIYLLNFLKIEF